MRYLLIILTSMLISTKAEALNYHDKEVKCLALNIYFESRGESIKGQKAVAWVTMNRTNDPEYPDNICDVVHDHGQFSWVLDKISNKPKDKDAWKRSMYIAWTILNNSHTNIDPTKGATMFHASHVTPSWKKHFDKTVRIDDHIFYK